MTDQKQEPEKEPSKLAIMKRDVVDVISEKIKAFTLSGELHMPEDYSAPNAMKAAWLALQTVEDRNKKKALEVCSNNSVANALLDMVVQGLNPAKDQCYFVVFGGELVLMRSYFGTVALLRRIYGEQASVWAEVVYGNDDFEYKIAGGRKVVVKHVQKLENIDERNIIAAYCVIDTGLTEFVEIMLISQIETAWAMGAAKGDSKAHRGFRAEMAKKTVINRASKMLINSSSDKYLAKAIARQAHLAVESSVDTEMQESANKETLSIPSLKQKLEAAGADAAGETKTERADAAIGRMVGAVADADAAIDAYAASDEPEGILTDADSPAAEFAQLIATWQLDATKARKVAAAFVGLDDVRKLGNVGIKTVLANKHEFLKRYENDSTPIQSPLMETGEPGPI